MAVSRRKPSSRGVRIVNRHPSDYAQELQDFTERVDLRADTAIPAGFNDTTPATVGPNILATPGTEAEGWAAADHVHAVDPVVNVKGDLLGFDTEAARVPVGTDGKVLTADSTAPLGLDWKTPAAGTGSVDESRSMIPRPVAAPKLVAGANVTLTENGLTTTIAASGAGGGVSIDEVRALTPRDIPPRKLVAGSNVTLTDNGLTTTIAATGGGVAVDDMSNILANQIFGG